MEETAEEEVSTSKAKTKSEPTQVVQADYFGFEETNTVMLPDDVSWVQHQTLNEGSRRKYLNSVNREVRLAKATGDAILNMQTGEERHALLKSAITGWNLMRDGNPVPFNGGQVDQFLSKANPKIIDKIEKDVRKHNPWLMQEVSLEDIDQQIKELEELRAQKQAEEEGKDN